jgi:hypothetical protein
MPVVGTNQTKNIVTPVGARKYGVYTWGDSEATWGDAVATWGGLAITPTNQSRTSSTTDFLVTDELDFLITDEGDFLIISSGNSVVNQSKS